MRQRHAGLQRPTQAELTAAIEATLTDHKDTMRALARIEREQEAKAPRAVNGPTPQRQGDEKGTR